jgi:hypothetical protein
MGTIKEQIIQALQVGNLEQVRNLKEQFEEEAAREKWLDSHFENGGVPVAAWLKPNPFISFEG